MRQNPNGPPIDPTVLAQVRATTRPRSVASRPHREGELTTWRTEEGVLHRTDGPAVLAPDGSRAWYAHGKLHNPSGPAVWTPDAQEYWVHGQRATYEQFAAMWNHEPLGSAGQRVQDVEAIIMRTTRRTARSGTRAGSDYWQVVARTAQGNRIRFTISAEVDLAERNQVHITTAEVKSYDPPTGEQVGTTRLRRVRLMVTSPDFTL